MSLRNNTVYNLLGSVVPAAMALVTIPLLLDKVGEVRFGVLALVWLLLGHFAVFDLGLSRATANRIARLAPHDLPARRQVFWTSLWLNLCCGTVGALILLVAAEPLMGYVLSSADAVRQEVSHSLPWIAAAVPLTAIGGMLAGALEGRERFAAVNGLQAAGAAATHAAPVVAAYAVGTELDVLIAALVLARTGSVLMLLAANLRVVVPGRPCIPQLTHMRELFRYGAWISVSALLVPFFMTLDKFMIGAMLGAGMVAYYAVPDQLVRRISVLPMAFGRSMFPRVSALDGAASYELSLRYARVLVAVVTPVVATCSVAMNPFLSVWIDPGFAELATGPGVVLAAGIWLNGIAMVPYSYLQGTGRPDITAKCHLLEILPHVIALWLSIRFFGAVGAAAAMLAVTALDSGLLMALARMSVWRATYFWQGAAWIVAACAVGLGNYDVDRWRYGAAVAIVCGAIAWALRLSPELAGTTSAWLRRAPVPRREA